MHHMQWSSQKPGGACIRCTPGIKKRTAFLVQSVLLALLTACFLFSRPVLAAVLPDGDYLVQMADSDLVMFSSGYVSRERVTVGRDLQSGIWHFKHLGNDYYKITAPQKALVLDSFGSQKYLGVPIISFPWHGANNQRWKVIPKGKFYSLISQETGFAVDLKDNAQRPGGVFQGYTENSSRGQLFRLTPQNGQKPPPKTPAAQQGQPPEAPAIQKDEPHIKSFSNGPSDE